MKNILKFLQNFSFARTTFKNSTFHSPKGEKLHSLCKTNRVLQEALFLTAIFFLWVIFLGACAGQERLLLQPVPGYIDNVIHDNSLLFSDITETREGPGNAYIPNWLIEFINGGIEEVEKIDGFMDKYCFIGVNEGGNFEALSKWADNYSVIQDFPRLAAVRIEKRLISAASAYPDDEYGSFYEIMVKKAFDAEYTGAFLEDIFWIKRNVNQEYSIGVTYEFYIFIIIDKTSMQTIIRNMMTEALAVSAPTRAQNNAIKRLQQIFFVGF